MVHTHIWSHDKRNKRQNFLFVQYVTIIMQHDVKSQIVLKPHYIPKRSFRCSMNVFQNKWKWYWIFIYIWSWKLIGCCWNFPRNFRASMLIEAKLENFAKSFTRKNDLKTKLNEKNEITGWVEFLEIINRMFEMIS